MEVDRVVAEDGARVAYLITMFEDDAVAVSDTQGRLAAGNDSWGSGADPPHLVLLTGLESGLESDRPDNVAGNTPKSFCCLPGGDAPFGPETPVCEHWLVRRVMSLHDADVATDRRLERKDDGVESLSDTSDARAADVVDTCSVRSDESMEIDDLHLKLDATDDCWSEDGALGDIVGDAPFLGDESEIGPYLPSDSVSGALSNSSGFDASGYPGDVVDLLDKYSDSFLSVGNYTSGDWNAFSNNESYFSDSDSRLNNGNLFRKMMQLRHQAAKCGV